MDNKSPPLREPEPNSRGASQETFCDSAGERMFPSWTYEATTKIPVYGTTSKSGLKTCLAAVHRF